MEAKFRAKFPPPKLSINDISNIPLHIPLSTPLSLPLRSETSASTSTPLPTSPSTPPVSSSLACSRSSLLITRRKMGITIRIR